MSRRRRANKRPVTPDPRYDSTLVTQLVNLLMRDGKKSVAQKIVYDAFSVASERLGKGDPLEMLGGALENTRPKLEVKSRRVGGATYQVPVEVDYERQNALAMRWMVADARNGKGPMSKNLGTTLAEAYENTGNVVKKKDDTHRMAQANRAFAHLRW